VQCVRRERRRVAMGRRQAAQLVIDLVGADQGRFQHRGALGKLGRRRRRRRARGASLVVEGDPLDAALARNQRDPHQIAARSAPGGAGEGSLGRRAAPGLIGEVLLEEFSIHGFNIAAATTGRPPHGRFA
jgi:hypothetical protein